MRVLFVTREYPPFEVGGVAKHTFHLVKHLNKIGVLCKVLSLGDSRFSSQDTVFVDPLSSIIRRSNSAIVLDAKIPLDIVRFGRIANELIKKEGFDIVHVEEPYVGGLVRHERKVTTVHDTSYGEIKSIFRHPTGFPDLKRAIFYASIGPYLEWKCVTSSKIVIVPAMHIKDELVRVYGVKERDIRVISNGINLPSPVNKAKVKQELNLTQSKLLVFTAAQHIARKRLDTLVQAVKLLCDEGVGGFEVAVSGDGPIRPFIQNMIRKYALDHVIHLLGWISEMQLNQYYQAADIFVLTSEYESGPISLLEAMSCGASVVSSKIGGFPRLMCDGVEGLLFPVGDTRALSKCLRTLLEDAELRAVMSNSARLFAEKFSWKRAAEETKRVYEHLL